MNSYQLCAGYVLEAVQSHLGFEPYSPSQSVLRCLSAYNLSTKGPVEPSEVNDPILAVASNIVARGLPTFPSLRVERRLSTDLGLTEEKASKGSISFPFTGELEREEKMLLRRALLPVDPDPSPGDVAEDLSSRLESGAEREFLESGLPQLTSEWVAQLLWPQRPLDTIVPADKAETFAH